MKLPKNLILSLLVHSLIIISSDSKCLHSFSCGRLTLSFPFTDINNPECGLFMVDGCNSTHDHVIQLELAGGIRYHLLRVWENNSSMSVRDSELQKLLKDNSYFALRNISFSKSPFVSLRLASPNLTLFSCKSETYLENIIKFTLLYEINDTSGCSMIQVPTTTEAEQDQDSHHHINLFNPLTDMFVLEWNVTNDCYQCHRRGGQCLSNSINDFYCKEGSSKLVLILAISGGGLLLLLLCSLISYIIWLRKTRVGVGYVRSSNVSVGPSKSDTGGGSSFLGIPIFSYTELEAATDSFDPSRELGHGGFGTVYHGKLLDGREVAIKRLYEQNCRRVEQFMNEIKILTSLRHPNLVCLYGCTSRRSRELLLVYEFIPNGTVADHLHGGRANAAPLTWSIRRAGFEGVRGGRPHRAPKNRGRQII